MGYTLVDNTEKIKRQLRQGCANGCNNAVAFWADEARDLAPVDTGFLKSGIGVSEVATENKLSATVRSIANYSSVVNFGGAHQAAQPYFTVAGLKTRQEFNWLMKSGFISISRGQSAGPGAIRAAMMDYFGPLGRKGQGWK